MVSIQRTPVPARMSFGKFVCMGPNTESPGSPSKECRAIFTAALSIIGKEFQIVSRFVFLLRIIALNYRFETH